MTCMVLMRQIHIFIVIQMRHLYRRCLLIVVGCICTFFSSFAFDFSASEPVAGLWEQLYGSDSEVADSVVSDTLSRGDFAVNDSIVGIAGDTIASAGARVDSLSNDSLVYTADSASIASLKADSAYVTGEVIKTERWIPDPKRAMWYAVVFPGGGQIYNRKYWKLPIVYGAFVGCAYALSWNNTMYRDYSQAYIDIMDDDPNTNSYENFLPPSYDIDANMERLKTLFQNKKNYYRRYRDLSIFCIIGVYLLSIVDAYVDAELSSFDISRDLSMKVQPAIIKDKHNRFDNNIRSLSSNSYGIQCSLNF